MFVLISPDGSPQFTTLTLDYASCQAIIQILYAAGVAKELHQMINDGFKIVPVEVTMTQLINENEN